jgi:hypothetical protein
MCQFFSFVTKGNKKYYFNWDQRKELMRENPKDYEQDSHTSICAFHNLNDDKVNKYEYNPLTREFTVDQINIKDDRALAKKWVESVDFKTIVEPLRLNKIIHPFEIEAPEISESHLKLLGLWAIVRAIVSASVWASVGASVRESVSASVRESVSASVWASVGASVRESVSASVRESVSASVWAIVSASVWASVWAYISDFMECENWEYIDHKPGENPFNPCIELWKQGIVPSYDGKKWRLHTKNGIAWEGE